METIITPQEIGQIWSSLFQGLDGGSSKVPSSIFFLFLIYLMKIHLTQHISLASAWRYVSHLVPKSVGETFHLFLNCSSTFFQSSGLIGQLKYSSNASSFKCINDGPTDFEDEFTYGFSANQPVILEGHVGFSCCQMSQHY